MKRDDFVSLPLKLALAVLWDLAHAKLEQMEAPTVPRPPKFDGRLLRRGGFTWLSELSERSLIYWRDKKRESANRGGEWADKDCKLADTMDKWIAWRSLFPYERWRGTRGDEKATADSPSDDPTLRSWDNSRRPHAGGSNPTREQSRSPSEPPPEEDDDSNF